MIDLSLHTPIQDPSVYQFPLDLVSQLLQEVSHFSLYLLFKSYSDNFSDLFNLRNYIDCFWYYMY